MGRWSPQTLHLMTEAMRRAFCDRARFLGDPAFTDIPAHLTSTDYAKKLAGQINRHRATPSADLAKDIPLANESDNTTHFSIIDKEGMAVANTYTLEAGYGSRVVVKGAGFLLNNEMMDFNWFPGTTDKKGRIGTTPNLIAPGKRMLSSQTPAIVAKDGKVVLVTGSPGSRTIINTVLCIVVNVLDFRPAPAPPVVSRRGSLRGGEGLSRRGQDFDSDGAPAGLDKTRRRPFHPGRSANGNLPGRRRPAHQRQSRGILA